MMKATFRSLLCLILLQAAAPFLKALTIVRTNDPSMSDTSIISTADADAASAAFDYAKAQIEAFFTDNIQINITLKAATTGLGGSSSQLYATSYATIRTKLLGHAQSNDDATANGNIPAVDPVVGGGLWWITRAQAKAFGLLASDSTTDGTFTFNAKEAMTYDVQNRAVADKYDFVGVALHEITEIMGRISLLGSNKLNDGGPDYMLFDLFRYTGPRDRNLTPGTGIYFSIDGGVTNLKNYNFPNGGSSDAQDWASGTADACNAFGTRGVLSPLTPVDIQVMDVIGYNLHSPDAEIAVQTSSGIDIPTGGSATSGTVHVGTPMDTVFTVKNTGASGLLLTGTPKVAVNGSTDFSVVVQPVNYIPPDGNVAFTVRFSPTGSGIRSAQLSIPNNDLTGNESPFIINLTGTGTTNSPPTDITLSSNSIMENNIPGALVGVLFATDAENDGHSFSLVSGAGGTDNASFTIVGQELRLKPSADFETKSSYSIRIRTTDSGEGNLTFEKALTIFILDANERPSFVKGADQIVLTSPTSPQTVNGWATSINDGDSAAIQVLTFNLLSSTNPALFAVQPAISSNGTLTYTPSGIPGTATVYVNVQDDNSINGTYAQSSVTQSFTITVPSGLRDSLNANIVGNAVYVSAAQPDGKILLAGNFSSVLGVARSNIARLNADGTLDTGFDPNSNGDVMSLAVQSDGKIIIGGTFTTVGGVGRARIARLNADGTLDTGFNPGADGTVSCLALQSDGKIVLGGNFLNLGGSEHYRLARLNVGGTVDNSFFPDVSGGSVNCLAVQTDGKVVFGGMFTTVGVTTRNRFARVDAGGLLDTGFNPDVNSMVDAVALQADGKILIGGAFTTVGGLAKNVVARLNTDGTVEAGFSPNANSNVYSLALQADGKILIGGNFLSVGGSASNYLARLNANGTRDTSFASTADSAVLSVAEQADGRILIGGIFDNLGGSPRSKFARLVNDAASQTLALTEGPQVNWTRGGAAPELSQVTFEKSSDNGSTWSLIGSGTRVGTTPNWQLAGFSVAGSGKVRARGRIAGGYHGGSSSFVESVADYNVIGSEIDIVQPAGSMVTGALSWGDNYYDQTTTPYAAQSDVTAVATGGVHNLALKGDGSVIAWGSNTQGESTVPVAAQSGVTAIAAIASTTVALKNGGVLVWGGNPGQNNVPVAAQSGVTAIAAGGSQILALKSDGSVIAWGTSATVPVEAQSGVIGIAGGGYFSVALKNDGSVIAWGDQNYNGPLNVPLAAQTGVVAIAAGAGHVVALKSDGSLVTWGSNSSGQLNVPLAAQTGLSAISAGGSNTLVLKTSKFPVGYGVQSLATTSPPKAFTIKSSGFGPLLIGSVSVTGGNASDFIVNTSGMLTSVPPVNGSTSFTVAFHPTALGLRQTTLRVTSNDADEAVTDIVLNGMAVDGPEIGVAGNGVNIVQDDSTPDTADHTDFGSVDVTTGVLVRTFAVANNGLANLTLGNVTLSGTNAADFTVVAAPVSPVPPGGSTTFQISFDPNALGLRTAQVSFVTNDSNESPFSFAIQGTGVPPLDATYSTGVEVPVAASSFTASGKAVALALNYVPVTGTSLTVVNNTGLDFIDGVFNNLAQGQIVELNYGGRSYRFVANYFGGTGNDLVLEWANNRIFTWGISSGLVPTPVAMTGALAGKTVLSTAGSDSRLALCSDGTIAAWGINSYGQLGDNTGINNNTPVAVNTTSGISALYGKTVVAISASEHSLALCSDGTVVAWGANGVGQLGDNSTTDRLAPVAVNTTLGVSALHGKRVVAISAGQNFSLALCSDGTVVSWGYNQYAQLGDNTYVAQRQVPVAVNTTSGVSALFGKTVKAISAGGSHSLALCSDGTMAAWGSNGQGTLGDNSLTDRRAPVAVNMASGVSALFGKTVTGISAGQGHSLVRCSDGTVVSWGYNIYGQLGINSTAQAQVPTAVNTASGVSALFGKSVTAIHSGTDFNVAICSDGNLVAWGGNSYGQVGDGSTTQRLVPVSVDRSNVPAGARFTSLPNAGGGVAGGYNPMAIAALSAPDITLSGNNRDIADGDITPSTADHTDFGGVATASGTVTRTFTIQNAGITTHTLGTVSLSGANAADFSIITQPATSLAAGGSTTFQVTFDPSANGLRSARLSFTTSGLSETTFDFSIQGTGFSSIADLMGLSLSSGELTPVFDAATTSYSASVGYNYFSITATPTPVEPNATLQVRINGGSYSTVAVGSPSSVLSLNVGANVLEVLVTAQDGTIQKTYGLTLTRAAAPLIQPPVYPPSMAGPTADGITVESAVLGGTVTHNGGAPITARGLVYSVTTTNANPQIGGSGVTVVNDPTNTTGAFSAFVTGLNLGTDYSFAAYATNSAGTTYTSPVASFTTLPSVPGSLNAAWNANLGINGSVLTMAVQPDGKTIIGGGFTSVGGSAHANLARLNADGTVDDGFTSNVEGGNPYCLAVQPDGKIVIGGGFSTVNGVAVGHIARLNADGSLESTATFNPGSGANGGVYQAAVQADGKILVSGNFTTMNGVANNYIARLNTDGSLESTTTFNPGTGPNHAVLTMAVQPDGKIVIGGDFNSVNGVAAGRIARLNADGSLESTTTFNPGSGFDNTVYCLTVQADGKILAGGSFATLNGTTFYRIARLNADGTPEDRATFDPGTGADANVYSLTLQTDGKILISGSFSNFNDLKAPQFVRLNANGSRESAATFNPGTGPNGQTYGVAMRADGKILIGGQVSSVNGTPRTGIALLDNGAVTQSLSIPNTSQVIWNRSGTAPQLTQVTFEKSADGGNTWIALGSGTRVGTSANWQLTGLSLPTSGSLRARGRTSGAYVSGSGGLIEQVMPYTAPSAPVVTTPSSASITGTTAFLGGTVTSDGGSSLNERGIIYSATNANADPTIGGAGVTKLTGPNITGTVNHYATGLTGATTYSFRAYAINTAGVSYSDVAVFSTLSAGLAITSPTSVNITASSAMLGGDVTNDGGSMITERGVVYSVSATNLNPTIGGAGVTKITTLGTTGGFLTSASPLVAGTAYSFKAFATNSV